MADKPLNFPTPPGGRERLIGRMLESEGVNCLADLMPKGPYIVGKYYFDEPMTYSGEHFREGHSTLQFSQAGDFEGGDPPEESWQDLAPEMTISERYWRLRRER